MTTDPKEEQVMGSYSAGSSCPQMGNDRPQPSGGIEDTDQAELCALIFDNVEASVDYIGKGKATPIAVLSDVMAAADAILAAGYRRLSAAPPTLEVGWRPIGPGDQNTYALLWTPPERLSDEPDQEPDIRYCRPRDFGWATLMMEVTPPATPSAGSGGIAATEPQALYEPNHIGDANEMIAPTPSDEIRERVARIVDEEALRTVEEAAEILCEKYPGLHLGSAIADAESGRRRLRARRETALSKADQIHAIYTGRGE